MKLRHYQKGCTPALVKYFRTNKGKHPLVVMPTGCGKSLCIADLVKYCRKNWNTKILILSHVKEILEQNYGSIVDYTSYNVGINSSMLGKREVKDITIAGIHSVYRTPELFSEFNLIIVDEAHLISTEESTMYQKFLSGIGKYICVGFTATPFRLGDGYIYGAGKMFDDIAYDWGSKEKFNQLVKEGYLSKLTTKRTNLEMDTSGIRMKAGDFSEKQLSDRFDREGVTNAAIKEIIAAGANRKSWMIFAIDINHAEHIAETLIRNGISTAPVHSKMSNFGLDRGKTLEGFKNGKYKCVVSVNCLTTGFDNPHIDLIALLRPTNSPVLHVQCLGRGSRVAEGKDNCLVLDFAGNTARLGPINDVVVKEKSKAKEGGDPITKTCPNCEEILAPAVRVCPECNHEFEFEHGLSSVAGTYEVVEDGSPHWLPVDSVSYSLNESSFSPSSVKVTYKCGPKKISEWICVEHSGFAKHKADHWIKFRKGKPCSTAQELMSQTNNISTPKDILIQKKGAYYNIGDCRF